MADKQEKLDSYNATNAEGKRDEHHRTYRLGRRQHPRFLFSAEVTVRLKDGIAMPGISVDMGRGGLSVMVSGLLAEGDTVQLDPIAGRPASARVRHKLGRLYGFEFVDLTAEQAEQIEKKCQTFGRGRGARRDS